MHFADGLPRFGDEMSPSAVDPVILGLWIAQQWSNQSADHIALRVADLDDECIKAPLTPRLKDRRRRL